MGIAENIRQLRTARGWSQEQMAEKLDVSRQAVTKWETAAGSPDIDNLAALARLFGVTTDRIILGVADDGESGSETVYESVTSVDILAEQHYDIKVGCAHTVTLRAGDGEKAVVRLSSTGIADLERAFKVALDTEGRSFDVEVSSTGIVADSIARQQLDVLIELPGAYSADAELELSADELRVEGACFDLEVGGQVRCIRLIDVQGHVELDVPVDMEVWADNVTGRIDVNQVGATSTVHVLRDAAFCAATRGHLGRRTLRFTRNGEPADAPGTEEAPLSIVLSGARCELTVDSVS